MGGWYSSHGYKYFNEKAEHRIVMENHLGRPLVRDEIIHHIDGNPINNDISNLTIISNGDHARGHLLGKNNEKRKEEKAIFGRCRFGMIRRQE
jgi:hypothetical protein